ncbi:hypothetical protein M0804_003898 [Polistes exclamans]|nr:hypothetical protein M0804_003898 [Polistes exclamans]
MEGRKDKTSKGRRRMPGVERLSRVFCREVDDREPDPFSLTTAPNEIQSLTILDLHTFPDRFGSSDDCQRINARLP